MKKGLLFGLAMATALGASAYNVDDYVFTKTARFQITGANLVQNGDFSNDFAGWNATDPESTVGVTFENKAASGPGGSNTAMVLEGQTALTAGMYQVVPVSTAGTYVVSFSVINLSGAGFTDLDLSGGNTNYINAYFNTDGTLATVDGTNLLFGENGVNGGYGFSYSDQKFTDVVFSIEAPQNGNIIIDFRGLAQGLEIANVELHAATEVYDIRIPQKRVNWINTILKNFNWTGEEEFYEDVQYAIAQVEAGIDAENWGEMSTLMENLDGMIKEFLTANAENVLDLIPTKDGSSATGNNSANWMNWTAKWNKLTSDYKNQAPWTWSTDRWAHKTAAANSPMQIQWMRGASGNWDNIATLTATLDKGTYFWGVSGSGGMMTLNKNRWARSLAVECAETQLFLGSETTEVFVLDPAVSNDYLYKFEVAEDGTALTLGIRCNLGAGQDVTAGFDVNFLNPVLYKMMEAGQLTENQKAYLAAVETQLVALKGRIDVANGYLAETQTELPWGKEALAEGVAEAQARYDAWAAMTQDDILEMQYNYEVLADTIMNNGVRFLNNNYINPFVAMNKPLTDMPGAVKAAQDVLATRMYESGDKATFEAVINAAQALYEEKIIAPFASEDSLALVEKKAELEAAAVVFKNSINKEILVDVDFGTQEAPAKVEKVEDPEGLVETYYTIDGAKGTAILPSYAAGVQSTMFDLGYNSTDSLGMLRVGSGEVKIAVSGAPVKESDIVTFEFDYYFGNLNKAKAGFKVLTEKGDTICGLYCSKYDNNDDLNTFGINYGSYINAVGSSSASNAAIAAESNRTHFLVVLDYGLGQMYCTTSGSKGTVTTEAIEFNKAIPATFVIYSNYTNNDRRSFFDNFVVSNVAAGVPNAIREVNSIANNGQIYTVSGVKVNSLVKGINIVNGKKYVK